MQCYHAPLFITFLFFVLIPYCRGQPGVFSKIGRDSLSDVVNNMQSIKQVVMQQFSPVLKDVQQVVKDVEASDGWRLVTTVSEEQIKGGISITDRS